ncbi:flippase-like domain-containing protein [Peteryoungia ipomoeae]|uniref:Flippase-like domain-containing protein n=1 Tax=Peteryoungia ipomoeae TaxID=1210932 RepID=A0A4S8P0I1_9HYPH|nr:flippase-like domain-containing protein [Peteryoungia ipomoeae]
METIKVPKRTRAGRGLPPLNDVIGRSSFSRRISAWKAVANLQLRKSRLLRTNRPLIAAFVVILAGILAFQLDWRDLVQTLNNVSLAHLAIGLILVQTQIVLSAVRWQFTAGRLGQEIGYGKAIREYYVASFLNQTLPGGMAGDAARAYRMRDEGPGGWKIPAKAVLFERISGQIGFFLFAALGLPAWQGIAASQRPTYDMVALTMTAVAVLAVIFVGFQLAKRNRILAGSLPTGDLYAVFIRDRAWIVQLGLSLTVVLSYIVTFMVAADAVGADLPWFAGLTIIPLCLLAMLIPTGFGGWGTREAAAMALFPLLGGMAAHGLAASLLYGGLSLAGALPGLVLLVLSRSRHRSAA